MPMEGLLPYHSAPIPHNEGELGKLNKILKGKRDCRNRKASQVGYCSAAYCINAQGNDWRCVNCYRDQKRFHLR